MPITPTTNLSLNMYGDGDNAGAGATNSSAPTNTGLNGNWHKLDALVGGITTTAGVILPNKVTTSAIDTGAVTDTKLGANAVVSGKIALSATDNSTLEVNAGILRVKDGGITALKLASDSVTTSKILDANVTTAKILDRNVTANKIETNCTRTKVNFVFTFNGTFTGSPYCKLGEIQMTNVIGVPMMRAGSITGIRATTLDGISVSTLVDVSNNSFVAGSILGARITGTIAPFDMNATIGGISIINVSLIGGAVVPVIVNVEVEYD